MSDYEMLNRRVAEKKAAMRQDALRRTVFLLAVVLAVLLVFVGLWSISFISDAFVLVLVSCTALWGAFRVGQIWNFNR